MSSSKDLSYARQAKEERVSDHECRAIRALDRDGDYTRSEIAFMFGVQVGTVARHADRECHHQRLEYEQETVAKYDEAALLDAYRQVYDRQPYGQMSMPVYDAVRRLIDDRGALPAGPTIQERFGTWGEARERAFGGGDDE